MAEIGLLLFPLLTQLDLTGPFEVLARVPGSRVHLVWRDGDPVTADTGMRLLPSTTFEEAPQLDVVLVPGGYGVGDLMLDAEVLDFLRRQAREAAFVVSVCTGALVLGAAGLLDGYRATTHWRYLDLLPLFGARPTQGRVVVDRNRLTGGGITAGIDAALVLAGKMVGAQAAAEIELNMEYAPAPPFGSGDPGTADPALVRSVEEKLASLFEQRQQVAREAARRLRHGTNG